jgi:hypothetical protein
VIDTDYLLKSLTASRDDLTAVHFDDGRYLDWSTTTDEGVRMELGEGADAVQVGLSRNDVARIQRALTLWLLEHNDAP